MVGQGCYICDRLFEITLQVLSEMGIAGDVEKVTDIAVSKQFGVTATPALLLNNQVKVVGRIPAKTEIREWIKSAIS